MISTNRLHICIGCCDFLSEAKKPKQKTHEEITCSEKYCTKTKTDWIAHVVWPDAVRWHASNVHTHSLHIYSNATIFLTRFLFRFQLITFCRVQMLVSHSIACLEMAIVVAASAHTVSTVNTEEKKHQQPFERHSNLKKLSVEHVPFRYSSQYYVILVFPADGVFATFQTIYWMFSNRCYFLHIACIDFRSILP